MTADTIFALSSASGKAGVAIVRVSGPEAFSSLKKLIPPHKEIIPRQALFTALKDPHTHALIDRAVIMPFKGPASFTGEDVVEYHLHGSPAVLTALMSALSAFRLSPPRRPRRIHPPRF